VLRLIGADDFDRAGLGRYCRVIRPGGFGLFNIALSAGREGPERAVTSSLEAEFLIEQRLPVVGAGRRELEWPGPVALGAVALGILDDLQDAGVVTVGHVDLRTAGIHGDFGLAVAQIVDVVSGEDDLVGR